MHIIFSLQHVVAFISELQTKYGLHVSLPKIQTPNTDVERSYFTQVTTSTYHRNHVVVLITSTFIVVSCIQQPSSYLLKKLSSHCLAHNLLHMFDNIL